MFLTDNVPLTSCNKKLFPLYLLLRLKLIKFPLITLDSSPIYDIVFPTTILSFTPLLLSS